MIVKVMETLPAGLGDETLQAAERQLVDWCRHFDPVEVARLGRRLWEVVDPDGADTREAELLQRQERDAKRQRQLSFGADGFGLHLLRGRFDTEAAAVIAAALDPLAMPLPSTADGPDPRSPGQRYADALVEVCRRQLDAGDLPSRGGEKPHVMVTIGLDQLKTLAGSGLLDTGERLSPEAVRKLACDAQVLPAVLGGDSRPLPLRPGVTYLHACPTPSDWAARRQRLRVPRLRSADGVVRWPPHSALDRRWSDRPCQRRAPLRLSPHDDSSGRLDSPAGRGRTTEFSSTDLDRHEPTSPTQSHSST
jgi:hypothetical protein